MSKKRWIELNEIERKVLLDSIAMAFDVHIEGSGARFKTFFLSLTSNQLDLLAEVFPDLDPSQIKVFQTPNKPTLLNQFDLANVPTYIDQTIKEIKSVDESSLRNLLADMKIEMTPTAFRKAAISLHEKAASLLKSLTKDEVASYNVCSVAYQKVSEVLSQRLAPPAPGPRTRKEDGLLTRFSPEGEIELTATIEMMEARLRQLYVMRRGRLITHQGHVGDEAWCANCGRNRVRPADGEDTCGSCVKAI